MHGTQAVGLLDTGAKVSAVPIWLLQRQGVPLDEGTRRIICGISGPLWAYSAGVGMGILCRGSWLDIGMSDVLVPDTPWSRDPSAHYPPLLGLNGFFGRVRMCIDHSTKAFWIGLPAAGGGEGVQSDAPPHRATL